MTNKPMLSVESELIQRIADHCKFWIDHPYLEAIADVEVELRAILDKEVDGNSHAPKHQGEPVAELQVAFFEHGPMAAINWFTPSAFESGATKLYAEQPAPVAVVMPSQRAMTNRYIHDQESVGWNACLTEVARLNWVKQ